MAIFLLTSFLSFLIVSLALAIRPLELLKNPISIPLIGKLTLDDGAKLRLRQALTCVIVLVGLVAAWLLFRADLSSRLHAYLPNLMFGLIFGPVFALWLGSLLKVEDGKFTMGHTVAGSILLVLFIVGLLGAETARLAEYYSRRITKLGLGGTELTFGDFRRSQRDSGGQTNSVTPPTSSAPSSSYKSGANETAQGLYYLSRIDFFMDRDCTILALKPNSGAPDCMVKAVPVNAAKTTLWTSSGSEFARVAISGYAKCVAGLYESTLDDGMATEYLQPFAEQFNQLSAGSHFDNDFAKRARDTYLNQSRKLLGYLQPAFLAREKPHIATAIETSCITLLEIFCDPHALTPQNRESGSPAAGKENDSAAASRFTTQQLQQCFTDSRATPAITPSAETVGKLTDMFNIYGKEKASAFRERPYAAIAHASVMFALGRYEAASAALHEWIDQYEQKEGLDGPGIVQAGKDSFKIWYAIRARSILMTYMDQWLTGPNTKAPDIVRDLHITNMQRYLDLLMLFPPAIRILRDLKLDRYDLEKDKYQTVTIDLPFCTYDGDYETGIILTYLATGNLFAYHALRHRDYGVNQGTVRRIVRDSMNADRSCIAKIYSAQEAAASRSDALELQAQLLMIDAERKRSANDFAAARALLESAAAAVGLSLQTVDRFAKDDIAEKVRSPKFIVKITSTRALSAREASLRTQDVIRRRLEELD